MKEPDYSSCPCFSEEEWIFICSALNGVFSPGPCSDGMISNELLSLEDLDHVDDQQVLNSYDAVVDRETKVPYGWIDPSEDRNRRLRKALARRTRALSSDEQAAILAVVDRYFEMETLSTHDRLVAAGAIFCEPEP